MAQDDLDPVLLAAAAKADALRAAGLAGLSGVTEARQAALERERGRLAETLGGDDPRVQALNHRLKDGATRLRGLRVEIARAKTTVPQVGEAEWAVHGHVRHADRTAVPDVTVLLVDSAGGWQRSLGYACSDADGYFRLVSKVKPPPPSLRAYLRVIDQERRELYRGEEALAVTPRAVEYREIVLPEGGRSCVSPGADFPTSAETVQPVQTVETTRTALVSEDSPSPPARKARRRKA